MTTWPAHLNKLFAEPPQLLKTASSTTASSSPRVLSAPLPRQTTTQSSVLTPVLEQTPPSQLSLPPTRPLDAGVSTAVSSTLAHPLQFDAFVQSNTSILLRNMPHDLVASAAVTEELIEDVSRRDISMRHPHVLNNLAMAGVVLSFLINVSLNHITSRHQRSYILAQSDITCASGVDFKTSLTEYGDRDDQSNLLS